MPPPPRSGSAAGSAGQLPWVADTAIHLVVPALTAMLRGVLLHVPLRRMGAAFQHGERWLGTLGVADKALGIDQVRAELLPEDKVEAVKEATEPFAPATARWFPSPELEEAQAWLVQSA